MSGIGNKASPSSIGARTPPSPSRPPPAAFQAPARCSAHMGSLRAAGMMDVDDSNAVDELRTLWAAQLSSIKTLHWRASNSMTGKLRSTRIAFLSESEAGVLCDLQDTDPIDSTFHSSDLP